MATKVILTTKAQRSSTKKALGITACMLSNAVNFRGYSIACRRTRSYLVNREGAKFMEY